MCHVRDAEHTHYENHTVYGEAIAARNTDPGRPNFKEGRGFFGHSSASTSYKLKTQEATLKSWLGGGEGARVFDRDGRVQQSLLRFNMYFGVVICRKCFLLFCVFFLIFAFLTYQIRKG